MTADKPHPPDSASSTASTPEPNQAQATIEIMQKDRRQLRNELRHLRRKLSVQEQTQAAASALQIIKALPSFVSAQHVAFYLANDGELDPADILAYSHSQAKNCYLPILNPDRKGHLLFARYAPGDKLVGNQYGILEPDINHAQLHWAESLDLVLTPLVGFDKQGNRMGMGGGYYDRSFAFKTDQKAKPVTKPMLLGLAHECQRVDKLSCADWDIPLQAVVTDKKLYTTE